MNPILRNLTIIALVLFSVTISNAQKKKDYTVVVAELTKRLETSAVSKLPLRIAVVPFTSSVPDGQNKFGEYLTESVTGKLLEKPNQFKVFERSRLDAIFKENELMVSGMMKTSEAMKIGQLLSVDALFSGTYTKLKSYIDVSGRLIDVVSGEILATYSGRIKMNKNLAQLFKPSDLSTLSFNGSKTDQPNSGSGTTNTTINIYNTTPSTTNNPVEDCKLKDKAMETRTEDLTSEEKIKSLVADAIKFPFENDCGKFHYSLMGRFMRYKIQNESYYNFLIRTLQNISFPTRDDRALGIIEFMTYDGTTDEEWKLILEAISKSERWTYRYVSAAFSKSDLFADADGQKRIDEYFELVNTNRMGKPELIPFNTAFFQCIQGLTPKNHRYQMYLYEKYSDKITFDEGGSTNNHYLYLNRLYTQEKDPASKSKIIGWVADYFNKYAYKKSADHLFEFAFHFDPETPMEYNKKAVEEKNREKAIEFPIGDLQLLIEKCRPLFTKYATKTEYQSTLESRINFCLKYNIDVPGAIPSLEEANAILKGNDLEDQVRVLKLLVQMGEKPRPLESTLIAALDKRSLDKKETLQEVQNYCIAVLGNIKTTNPKAIAKMIASLKSFNYREADNSQEALVKIGKPAVKPVMDRLSITTLQEGGLQYKLVVILGRIGSPAKPSEGLLKKILSESRNPDIRYAAEAALQSFR